jgi:hypothetical protein
MQRILALQALSFNVTSFNEEIAESAESNVCSSETIGTCSAQSVSCQTTSHTDVDFW